MSVAGDVVVQTSLRYAAVAVELRAVVEFVLAGPAEILLIIEQRAIKQH